MKKTKRQQNSMIINGVFNTLLFLIFVIYIGIYAYPSISNISEGKIELKGLSQDIQRIEKSGISYDEFKSLKSTQKDKISDVFIQKLLDKVDDSFYSQYIVNKQAGDFNKHIEAIQEELETDTQSINEKSEDVQIILPAYGDYVADDEEVITDFDFTSYLERLFTTFNLQYDGKIGIGDLEAIGIDDTTQSNAQQELNASLYVTNLKLDIVGRKKDMLNFIHYFENVGSIEIQDEQLSIYSDDTISQFGKPIVLSGDNRTSSYNIYLHQLGDIEYLRMSDYIDGSLDTRDVTSQSLQEFIRQTQGDRRYEFEVSLNFYFKGLPKYKAREFITEFIKGHNNMKKQVKQEISQVSKKASPSNQDRQYIGQLKSIDLWLTDTTKEVQKLSKELQNSVKIESIYRQVLDLQQNLDSVSRLIENYTNLEK